MDPFTLTGTAGLLLLLTAFILSLAGRMDADSVLYLLMNIVGCMLLTWYAVALESIPFMILEGTWGLSSFIRLILVVQKKRRVKGG